MHIPHTVDPRPDTGLTNGKLGVWLFLASEVMLFGGLFSAYVLVRSGALDWPRHRLGVGFATFNTVVLIASSMTMVMAWASLRVGRWQAHRRYLAGTLALALVFLAVKFVEYREHLAAAEGPSRDMFFATYFTLTGLHALHIVGGVGVMAYFLAAGGSHWRAAPEHYALRIETTGLYWHFVDMVWIFLFPVLYLL